MCCRYLFRSLRVGDGDFVVVIPKAGSRGGETGPEGRIYVDLLGSSCVGFVISVEKEYAIWGFIMGKTTFRCK